MITVKIEITPAEESTSDQAAITQEADIADGTQDETAGPRTRTTATKAAWLRARSVPRKDVFSYHFESFF
jgi:hypothetical protein